MCGRFYIDDDIYTDARNLSTRVLGNPGAGRRLPSDVTPGQRAPVLMGEGQDICLKDVSWGFPQRSGKGLFINARAETALKRPTFRDSALNRRCVIPARHFYEWDPEKNKVTFLRGDEAPMYMAGFFDLYGEEDRFVILTTEANDSVDRVHPRMPLILERDEVDPWIFSREETAAFLKKIPGALISRQTYEQQSLFD